MRGKNYRRFQEKKKKDRVKDYYGGYPKRLPEGEKERHIGKIAHTPKFCSCPCCGNPRRHFDEETRQEKRHKLND